MDYTSSAQAKATQDGFESSTAETDAISREQLSAGEVLRIELYASHPIVERETVIREKIQIKKLLAQETANP